MKMSRNYAELKKMSKEDDSYVLWKGVGLIDKIYSL
jgi:hypothetical protein